MIYKLELLRLTRHQLTSSFDVLQSINWSGFKAGQRFDDSAAAGAICCKCSNTVNPELLQLPQIITAAQAFTGARNTSPTMDLLYLTKV